MEANDILTLTPTQARARFGKNLRKEMTKLIRLWHPDVSSDPRAREVTEVLTRLRSLDSSTVSASLRALREFVDVEGKRFGLRPMSSFFDAGVEVLVCPHSVVRIYPALDADLAEAYAASVADFRFADAAMETQMRKFLPEVPKTRKLADGSVMHVFKRRRDQMPLRDLLLAKGPLDPKASAWITSALLNILCWVSWSGRVHGGVSPESLLVSPELHEVMLLGGWEFSAKVGERPLALPDRTLMLFPGLAGKGGVMSSAVDLALVRESFMQIVGATHLSGMLGGGVPEPLARWAAFPASGSAPADYEAWHAALSAAFGKRRFIDMGITPEDIYEVT